MNFWWQSTRTCQAWLLTPIAWIYRIVLASRRLAYRINLCRTYIAPVPVIVVGNLTVGGTGKTPLVIALAEYLQQQGLKVGIVSRGYGAKAGAYPVLVTPHSEPKQVGDEPLLMAKRTHCPVMIDPKRPRAIATLLKQCPCDVILSDDGLQHLAMQPTLSIIVIDGVRRFGNGLVLPAGPLREPLQACHGFAALAMSRAKNISPLRNARNDTGKKQVAKRNPYLWVVNGEPKTSHEWPMTLHCDMVYQLQTAERKPLTEFVGQKVVAIAGIGNPQRFFTMLETLGMDVEAHAFPDHHAYTADDFKAINPEFPWLMTEKDAVKCVAFVTANTWVVPVNAALPSGFWQQLQDVIVSHPSPAD